MPAAQHILIQILKLMEKPDIVYNFVYFSFHKYLECTGTEERINVKCLLVNLNGIVLAPKA